MFYALCRIGTVVKHHPDKKGGAASEHCTLLLLTMCSTRCAELVVKHHPDKNGGAASEHFLCLVEAWRTLGSPAARRRYDAQRANARLTARQATPAILCCSFMMNENIFLLTF